MSSSRRRAGALHDPETERVARLCVCAGLHLLERGYEAPAEHVPDEVSAAAVFDRRRRDWKRVRSLAQARAVEPEMLARDALALGLEYITPPAPAAEGEP